MISVVIPALNESPTVASVVKLAWNNAGVTEVIVVDDGSIDDTAALAREAGARVITSTILGKGASLADGGWAATNEVIVFLDGDLTKVREDLVSRLAAPILEGKADFVKAKFTRAAGRVTVLTARPLLKTFFPELNHIEQPLGGMIAIKRSLLRNLRLETDYGVDVGLLLDVHMLGAKIEQVEIGHIEHDSQSLTALGDMATQVVRVILDRAARYGRLDVQQVHEVSEVERHAQAELDVMLSKLDRPNKLALFDMDGTLLRGRFVVHLAQRTNKLAELNELLDHAEIPSTERTQRISALFAGVPKEQFEEVARGIPLISGAAEVIINLRKRGYRVGIVSDSYFVATEIVRRRVFADFSIAHLLKFRRGIATGDVVISPAMQHTAGCPMHQVCKHNVLLHFCERFGLGAADVLAVGDGEPDICMLQTAGISVAFEPKSEAVHQAATHVLTDSLLGILNLVP